MTTETDEEREARYAAGAAAAEARERSPEHAAWKATRIAAGLCVIETDRGGTWESRCLTHDVKAELGHDLDINGTTNPDGTARND
jgi:hypothetical protein